MDFTQIAHDFGPLVAVVAYVIWSGWIRERSSNKWRNGHEKWLREILVGLVERSTQVIAENNVILSGIKQTIEQNGLVLQEMREVIDDGKQKSE